jgi:hypothetical protein
MIGGVGNVQIATSINRETQGYIELGRYIRTVIAPGDRGNTRVTRKRITRRLSADDRWSDSDDEGDDAQGERVAIQHNVWENRPVKQIVCICSAHRQKVEENGSSLILTHSYENA